MNTKDTAVKAFDYIKNDTFSKAKPLIRSIIGDGVNKELETRNYKKVRCTVPEIPSED